VVAGLGAAKRFPGLDKSAYPKVWNLISSLPKPKHDTLEQDAAIKAIKNAGLSSTSLTVAKDEPLGITQGTAVVVDSAEYVFPSLMFLCAWLTMTFPLQHQARRTPSEGQAHWFEHARGHSRSGLGCAIAFP